MDQAADVLRARNADASREDLKLLFREVQLSTMPGLSREDMSELFEVWVPHHLARLQVRLDASMT